MSIFPSYDAIFTMCSHTFEKDGLVRRNISILFPCVCSCACPPWSLQFLVRVFTFLSLILCYSYFGTFLSTWSVMCNGYICITFCWFFFFQILKLSKLAQGKTAAGKVVNLLSNDVNRFDFVTNWLHFVWIMPIQTVVITYFIWDAVGWSALIGVLGIFLQTVPVQSKYYL